MENWSEYKANLKYKINHTCGLATINKLHFVTIKAVRLYKVNFPKQKVLVQRQP